jgi:hypothetical protein
MAWWKQINEEYHFSRFWVTGAFINRMNALKSRGVWHFRLWLFIFQNAKAALGK